MTTEVLICGAGAAGLTLALDLARRGVAFRLIDKLPAPFHGSRGKGIQPRSQEVFEDLGVLDRLIAAGGWYPPQRNYQADGSYLDSPVADVQAPSAAEPYRRPLLVPQFLTEAVLRERLLELGHSPVFGQELIGFEQDDEGVTARIAAAGQEYTVRARYLIGADGGRSAVRHMLKIDFPGQTLNMRAIFADVALTGLERDVWHRFNHGASEQQLAICPLAGTTMFQVQAPVPLEGEVDLSAAGLTAMIAARSGRQDIQVHSVQWASAYSMNARLADRYRVGRVFLMGDAAHIHPPTGGQGLNTSVQDAYNLGWKLAAVLGGAADRLLDTYEEERRPVAAGMLGMATRLLDEAKRGNMRRGREVQQLDLGYADSSLALAAAPSMEGVQAGARAPDAPLRHASGQAGRLFDVFKGTHWTLLSAGEVPASVRRPGLHVHRVGQHGDLMDEDGHVGASYDLAAGQQVLVRPDGYVGAVLAADAVDALHGYLELVGLRHAVTSE
jgi:2-polyprenyl-6-methoxyphenol hydroxylase-like FAD-dependent oxidoreductase